MRITADIIDDECEPGCEICEEAAFEGELSKEWKQKIEEDLKKAAKSCGQLAEQRKTIEPEKPRKFNDEQKNTKRDPPRWYSYAEGHPRRALQDDRFKDMCSKFRNLNISGEENLENIRFNRALNEEPCDLNNDALMLMWDLYELGPCQHGTRSMCYKCYMDKLEVAMCISHVNLFICHEGKS